MSAIQDDENEKSTESQQTSPHFGVKNKESPKETEGLPECHQLKKILTEEDRGNYSISGFSFRDPQQIDQTKNKEDFFNLKANEKNEQQPENIDSAYVYCYSLKKPRKTDSQTYDVEHIITPVKSSSRKKEISSHLISNFIYIFALFNKKSIIPTHYYSL